MTKHITITLLIVCMSLFISAQNNTTDSIKRWTETDRKFLLDNLTRSRDELIKETKGLTDKQWNFKESPDRWSIKEVTEHIGIWELLLMHEVSRAIAAGEQPELNKTARADSIGLNFLMEEKPHISIEYTKPFTYTLPMGLNDGKNNLAWILKMRNESIGCLNTATINLRSYFLRKGRGNVHQNFISIFGHTDRHLRQIRKIKAHPNYPAN